MFLGEYQHMLDAKGRVSLPRRFRDKLPGNLIVAKGLEKCLYVLPAESYSEFLDSLVMGNDFDPEHRRVRRFFTSGAVEVDVDKAGRVGLSQALREYAGLEPGAEVVVAGNGDRIEIWDTSARADYEAETNTGIEDAARRIAEKGIC